MTKSLSQPMVRTRPLSGVLGGGHEPSDGWSGRVE